MATDIYFDSVNGTDAIGNGSQENPYKTMTYFSSNIAIRVGVDYNYILADGTYPFSALTFQYFQNCTIRVIGRGLGTVIRQSELNYTVGSLTSNTVIEFCRAIYDCAILTQSSNINSFYHKWNFKNILFRNITPASFGFFFPQSPSVIKMNNCVKFNSTTDFFRLTSGSASVQDSAGLFTNGYGTTTNLWDAGGNLIQSITFDDSYRVIGHETSFLYAGEYNWGSLTIQNKYIIQSESEYFYYDGNQMQSLGTTLTLSDIKEYGMDILGEELNYFINSSNLKIIHWTDGEPKTEALSFKTPKSQLVVANGDISLIGVDTINSFTLLSSGDVKVALSFNSGTTWKALKNGIWETVDNAHTGMTNLELNSLTDSQIEEVRNGSSNIRFSYSLTGDAEVDSIEMKVSLQGYEKLANTADFDISYDESTNKIVYTVKRDMSASINYVDSN